MIYSVHGYYGKYGSRKHQAKIECLVFASNEKRAEQLVKDMFDGYPATFDRFSVIGGLQNDLEILYKERPELRGTDPETGYIYNEFYHKSVIHRYFKR